MKTLCNDLIRLGLIHHVVRALEAQAQVSKCADTGADQGAAGGNGWRINTPGEACDTLIQVMYCEVRVLDLYIASY